MYAVFNLRTGLIVGIYGNETAAWLNATAPYLTVRRVYTRSLRRG